MKKKTKEKDFLAKELGEKLRISREKLGLTQKQLAEKMPEKIDYTYIGKIERGEIMPSVKMLKRISRGMNIPLDFFFQRESLVELLGLLPEDIRDIVKDSDKLAFLREVQQLEKQDVCLITEIIRILNKHRASYYETYLPSTKHASGLVAEKRGPYKRRHKKSGK